MKNRILRSKEVEKLTGLSRVTIYRKHISGDFPKPLKLGPNSIGWKEIEVQEWLDNLPRVND